jgi:tetratricopeptide (TPR) repeat protein
LAVVLLVPSFATAAEHHVCPSAPAMSERETAGTIPDYGRGATPEQRRVLEAAFTQLSSQYGVCRGTLIGIARAVGESTPGIDPNELLRRVTALANDAVQLRGQIDELQTKLSALGDPATRDPALAALADAQKALDDGRLADAEKEFAKLQFLRDAQLSAAGDAWITAVNARANVRKLEQDFDGATELLMEAEREEAKSSQHRRFELLSAAADAQYDKGDLRGDNVALTKAIAMYTDQVLPLAPRDEAPLDWAATQDNLGIALGVLGGRESGTAHLEQAVVSFQAALQERTRERVPLDWAATQTNLGNALEAVGERDGGTAHLEQAVVAYRAALQETARERAPLDWAAIQNGLGNALDALGERESGNAHLEQAVAAFQEALKERTRERVPLDWAMTKNNLGDALVDLGERENGTARLEQAVDAFQAALKEYTRERVPLRWATIQNNLGAALEGLGEREGGTAHLELAVAAYQAALQERTRERVPLDWAETKVNLGNVLVELGQRENGTAPLEQAVAAYQAALQEITRERVPLQWAATQNNLGNALENLGERESGTAHLEQAVVSFQAALQERTRERVPLDWAATQSNLGNALLDLGEREVASARHQSIKDAITAYEQALDILQKSNTDAYQGMRPTSLSNAITRAKAELDQLR